MGKIFLLNGPPRTGKDTAAKGIVRLLGRRRAKTIKIAEPIKRACHAMYGLPPDTPVEAFDHCKNDPRPEFFGEKPRDVYIRFSEKQVKPILGKDFFGRVAANTMRREFDRGVEVALVSDSGFTEEAYVLIGVHGRDNVTLVRIRGEGRGKTYAGDSRSYISISEVTLAEIDNSKEGNECWLVEQVMQVVTAETGITASWWRRLLWRLFS